MPLNARAVAPGDGAAAGAGGLPSDSEQSDWGEPAGGSCASSLSDRGASDADEADYAGPVASDGPGSSQPAAAQGHAALPEPAAAAPEPALLQDGMLGFRGPPRWGAPAPASRPPGCLVELMAARSGGRADAAPPASACTSEATLVAQVLRSTAPCCYA